jgi:hypothetical protein
MFLVFIAIGIVNWRTFYLEYKDFKKEEEAYWKDEDETNKKE